MPLKLAHSASPRIYGIFRGCGRNFRLLGFSQRFLYGPDHDEGSTPNSPSSHLHSLRPCTFSQKAGSHRLVGHPTHLWSNRGSWYEAPLPNFEHWPSTCRAIVVVSEQTISILSNGDVWNAVVTEVNPNTISLVQIISIGIGKIHMVSIVKSHSIENSSVIQPVALNRTNLDHDASSVGVRRTSRRSRSRGVFATPQEDKRNAEPDEKTHVNHSLRGTEDHRRTPLRGACTWHRGEDSHRWSLPSTYTGTCTLQRPFSW